jgi:hypothetical protein
MRIGLSIAAIIGFMIAQGLVAKHVQTGMVRVCNPDTKACQFVRR